MRPPRVRVQAEGCFFLVDPWSNFGGSLVDNGCYEPELTKAVESFLRPGDTFVDVGANEGWFSTIGARVVGPSGMVIAAEPQERCWSAIHRNFTENDFLNYRIVPCAIGETEGATDIILYPSLNGEASTLVSQRRRNHFPRQRTKIIRLDTVVDRLGITSARLVKIDCEGFELNVLKGAKGALRAGRIEYLLVELHPQQLNELGQCEADVADYLRSLGYYSFPADSGTIWARSDLVRP